MKGAAGTLAAAVQSVQKAIADALAAPDVRQKFGEQGVEPRGWDSAQTGCFIQTESAKWQVIKNASVTIE